MVERRKIRRLGRGRENVKHGCDASGRICFLFSVLVRALMKWFSLESLRRGLFKTAIGYVGLEREGIS